MQKIHEMGKSLKVGEQGEKIIKKFLQDKPYIKKVEDLRYDKQAQKADIDFLAHFTDGSQHGIEVKTDQQDWSHNIFVEELSSTDAGTSGCMMKTQARFVIYYFININKAYIINMDKFRPWYQEHKEEFILKKNIKNRWPDGRITRSTGRVINHDYLAEFDFVKVADIPASCKN